VSSVAIAVPRPLLPRLLPVAIGLLLGGTMLSATMARLERPSAPPAQTVIASARLSFADTHNGGVEVRNASGAVVAEIPARQDGFLRMVLRLMAGARSRDDVGGTSPFVLTQRAGQHLQLTDPATGEQIELEAFGPSNVAEFAALLGGSK
jgi:putative photosynthetic complex assembly protein